jgi:hypothetical protein
MIMTRKFLKQSIVLVVFAVVFTGCSQQVKETTPLKTENTPAIGLPVRVGLQNEKGLPVEVKVKNEQPLPVSLNLPEDKKFSVEIDTKDKQVIPVKVEGMDNLEKFLRAFVTDMNTFSVRLNLPQGSQFPPLHVELPTISSRVLMVVTGSVLAVMVAVFGALLAAFFAWRTSLNMKKIEKKIRNSKLDK